MDREPAALDTETGWCRSTSGTDIEERTRADGTIYHAAVQWVRFEPPYPTMTIKWPEQSLMEELDRICSDQGLWWSADAEGTITIGHFMELPNLLETEPQHSKTWVR